MQILTVCERFTTRLKHTQNPPTIYISSPGTSNICVFFRLDFAPVDHQPINFPISYCVVRVYLSFPMQIISI